MPLVVIGGYEGVVQVFDNRSRRVVLQHRIGHKICSLSFHPSGKTLLLSTKTSVRLYSVLPNRLHESWQVEDLQQPALVRFSRGGDRFAVGIGNVVQIYDTLSLCIDTERL